jgi:hypothetical protein
MLPYLLFIQLPAILLFFNGCHCLESFAFSFILSLPLNHSGSPNQSFLNVSKTLRRSLRLAGETKAQVSNLPTYGSYYFKSLVLINYVISGVERQRKYHGTFAVYLTTLLTNQQFVLNSLYSF